MLTATTFIIMSFIITEIQIELIFLALITYLLCYMTIIIKATEKSSMHKWITPDKLTEGDWILQPIESGKIKIKPEKLGITKEQVEIIHQLYKKNKIKKVLVKYGIPFAPAFLLSFITTLLFNNILLTIFF